MKNRLIAVPHLLWMAVFMVVPILLVIYYAFTKPVGGSVIFTLENFQRAFSPDALTIFADSLIIAIQCTVICLLLGYPVSYILSSKKYKTSNIVVFMFVVPMWMNFLLRTYGWVTIIDNNGVLNSLLVWLGLPKVELINTRKAILLGMIYNYLPFMILPLSNVLKKIDGSLIEAAQDLGANGFNVFTRLIFPLSMPGVIAGITMVFMPSVTTFIISALLGGGKYFLIGNLIENQFLASMNWNYGSALSIILMAIILISMILLGIVDKDKEGGGSMI